jgi:hypothetical protein
MLTSVKSMRVGQPRRRPCGAALFIRSHNETLPVPAMRVNNPDRSPETLRPRARVRIADLSSTNTVNFSSAHNELFDPMEKSDTTGRALGLISNRRARILAEMMRFGA